MKQLQSPLEQSTLLYQRHASVVLAYLLRQIASREDAEDLLLDIFVVVLEKGESLGQDEQRQRAWLLTVARNKVADYYRRFTRKPSIPLLDVEDQLYEREENAPERVALRREEYRNLYSMLKHLPEPQREILQLRYGHELSCEEIASLISKSESAVRMMLYRAIKALRALYPGNEQKGAM